MKKSRTSLFLARLFTGLGILVFSLVVAVGLVMTRPKAVIKAPAEAELAVSLQSVVHTNIVVRLEGFGVARPLRSVRVAPEVGGRVSERPRALKAGDRVDAGEVLFRIEDADMKAALDEARAARARVVAALAQIDIQEKSEGKRVVLLKRSRELALTEFERVSRLYSTQQIGSATAVDNAEQALKQAENALLQSEQTLALLPERRKELDSEFRASESRVARAELNVRRCVITAPFAGRIVSIDVEVGHIAQPGVPVLTLVDDAVLEIEVAISASDLRQWLPFDDVEREGEPVGFPPLSPLPVDVEWSDGSATQRWKGRLHRVVSFDSSTRSAMVAVRVEGDDLIASEGGLPLTDGMFCHVLLPGRRLEQVTALPRGAVTFDGNVYLSVDGRLKTFPVTLRRSEGQSAFVSGLREGDQVVVTRLVAPLEGVKLIPVD